MEAAALTILIKKLILWKSHTEDIDPIYRYELETKLLPNAVHQEN
jgi:hypothetical protein